MNARHSLCSLLLAGLLLLSGCGAGNQSVSGKLPESAVTQSAPASAEPAAQPATAAQQGDTQPAQKITGDAANTIIAAATGDGRQPQPAEPEENTSDSGQRSGTDVISAHAGEKPAPTPSPAPTMTPFPTVRPTPAPVGEYIGYGTPPDRYSVWYASVQSGYLALRRAKAYDSSNEIGKIQNGEPVYLVGNVSETYWYVYAPTLGIYGYVNSDYLSGTAPAAYYTVRVQTGYLALRSQRAYDSRNEIGKLYTGERVQVLDTSYGEYWYVYAPSLDRYGYVNSGYLVSDGAAPVQQQTYYWTVRVQTGYLALRGDKAYDSANELGKLYTGDVVEVIDSSDSTYWYVYAPSLNQFGYVICNYLW